VMRRRARAGTRGGMRVGHARCGATARAALRAGVHTGECVRMGEDLGGIAVHIGARIAAEAAAGAVLTSSTGEERVVGSGLNFQQRGSRMLKAEGEWRLFAAG